MALYTYDDFVTAANSAGLLDTISEYDLKLAKADPDAGMSLLQYKKDWVNAKTDDARAMAHSGAEELRKQYGYSGGEEGSGYYLNKADSPNYESAYSEQIKKALEGVTKTPEFSYDPESDPLYSTVKKQYLREGDRAAQNTLADAAAMTGGLPSSYAVGAATQAGNLYAGKLADRVPDLYETAYGNYLNEYNRKLSDLSALQNADATEYEKYLNEYSRKQNADAAAYEKYLNEYNQKSAEQSTSLKEAETAARYGDFSKLESLGIDTSGARAAYQKQLSDMLSGNAVPAGAAPENGEAKEALTKAVNQFNSGNFTGDVIDYLLQNGYTLEELYAAAPAAPEPSEQAYHDALDDFYMGIRNYETIFTLLAAGYTLDKLKRIGFTNFTE